MDLIARAPWRQAVTYRETWPHEDDYVLNRALLYRDRRDFVIGPVDTGTRGGDAAMEEPEIESVEMVDVRKKWRDEARDFTPWLAKNLDLLGKALDVKLECPEQEVPVGPFSLDILAKEVDRGVKVAIENQLEWTDFSHLGQLLTYAAGVDAGIAIWVAPEFRYEHAEALDRLNEWTCDGIEFYGVQVRVIKIGNSLPAPEFRLVVYPGGWNKDIALSSEEISPITQQLHAFFQPLIDDLIRTGFADKAPVQRFGRTGRHFYIRSRRDIAYAASLEGENDAWVTLHIETEDGKERTKEIFDTLRKDQEQIEQSIGAELDWRRYDPHTFSSISLRRDGSIDDPPEKLAATREWMLEYLPRLKEVMEPRMEAIMAELEREAGEA